jgi:antitoxin FitA
MSSNETTKSIQVRNVPVSVHRTLAVRAAQQGMSLSEYLLRRMTEMASKPTLAEVIERVREREPVNPDLDTAAALRAERDSDPR